MQMDMDMEMGMEMYQGTRETSQARLEARYE